MSFFKYMLSLLVKDPIHVMDKVSITIFFGLTISIVGLSKMIERFSSKDPIDSRNSVFLFFNVGLVHGIMGYGHSASPFPFLTETQSSSISFERIFSKSIKSNF